ncbi:uncharacterized protein LOC133791662 [Humulus lupulus]|uniref:uncharacterized protein LOC133791662 n=1 Tax=Humulus lupulus TaxID=3486 RepID=UPI002B40CC30|nr:uncharacterized protein LOC133791662 [Humulus lupulus]
MILQDILKNYRRKNNSPRYTIKIDISKAYDTVDWNFVEDLLNALNFPARFFQLVMICIKSTSYSLLMNGRIQGGFQGAKGLRQGDPLSPLIFVMIMDYLTRCFLHAALDSKFRYHPLCKSLKLINLCFADDLILLSKGSKQSIKVLKEVLDGFNNTTGLFINVSKSQIFFGGVDSREKREIIRDIYLAEDCFPLKYLGVPLRPTKWKAEDCGIIIKKIRLRLNTWGSRHLSFAGRVQLIHSVLLGLRNYWMSTFILPQSVSKEVEKLCRGFLWGMNGNRSRIHVASWEKVCLPKPYGGLGFKEGTKWNQAILAKYIWAITEKRDLLWVKWVNNIYLKRVSIWSYDLKVDTSWYWRKLCRLRLKFPISEILMADSLLCPVCGDQPESHHHLFFDCCLSRRLVELVFQWLGFRGWPLDFACWLSWLSLKASGMVRHVSIAILAATCYNTWLNRNRCVFEGYSKSDSLIALDVKTIVTYRLFIVKNSKLSRQDRDFIHRLKCN